MCWKLHIGILLVITALTGCTESFEIPFKEADKSILIVEGDVLVGANVDNRILLSRIKSLNDLNEYPEKDAKVEIINSTGTRWLLQPGDDGEYKANLSLPVNAGYALRITTADGKQYESPNQTALETPPIDSLSWKQENGVATVFVHSRSRNASPSRFYRWNYTETWESRAWYETYFDFMDNQIITRPVGDQIYRCWKNAESSAILIGNTNGLSEDAVSYKPVTTIEKPSEKMYTRYSILVRQFRVSKEAYAFWEILKKNTELTGSLFDPQPSQLTGNLRCVNDPNRQVIGFVTTASVSQARLFIRNSELPGWPTRNESQACAAAEFSRSGAEFFLRRNPGFLPAYFITAGGGFGVAPKACVDCRLLGGKNVQPTFW